MGETHTHTHTQQSSIVESCCSNSVLIDKDRGATEQLAPRVLPQRFSDGGKRWGVGWGEGGANLDGPLAVHSGGIKAGVEGRSDDSCVCSQHATTSGGWKTKTKEQRGSKNCVDGSNQDYTHSSGLPVDLGMAEYLAKNPGCCTSESVMRLISIMLPDDVTSRGLDGGLWPHFLFEKNDATWLHDQENSAVESVLIIHFWEK